MAAQTNTSKRFALGRYFKSVKAELKKVSWPNKKELKSYTVVVLVTCLLAALGIWIADSVFGQAIKFLVR
ncbi:MAG: preprotein translocase subunit SecE [Candidatus Petromonas sp.]|jgi:preprotein translocase subunit SecE|nr:preprotein translocase subunit SecE [Candidatus Petromonas sp.]